MGLPCRNGHRFAVYCRLDFLNVTVGDLRRFLTGRRVAARRQDFLCIPWLTWAFFDAERGRINCKHLEHISGDGSFPSVNSSPDRFFAAFCLFDLLKLSASTSAPAPASALASALASAPASALASALASPSASASALACVPPTSYSALTRSRTTTGPGIRRRNFCFPTFLHAVKYKAKQDVI
ncbi:hypothetical protein T09_12459 [Trichinella sp. T9]|nr:hypothetical protein T09_12459 [Trichinella sp. T9]